MFQLTALIDEDSFFSLPGEDWKADLHLLARHAVRTAPSSKQDALEEALTAKGQGDGIPLGHSAVLFHTRVDMLDAMLLAIGLRTPVGRKQHHLQARLVLAIVIPPSHARTYLSFLARLNRWLSRAGTPALLETGDRSAIMASLRAFDGEGVTPP